MKRIILFVLILGFSLELSDEDSECVRATPNSPEECYSLTPEKIHQTCCYFEGRYYDTASGQYKSGPSCLEAYRSDVNTGKNKAETQKKIEAGTYWDGYPAITDMKAFSCFVDISECEQIQPAKNEDSCVGAQPELNNEICCYLESDWYDPDGRNETNLKSCVDVIAADVENEQKKQETIEKIKNGTYWPGYGYAKNVNKLVCKKAVTPSSSTSLMTNLLSLALVLFMF
jgi:hypothetical protein